MNKQEQVARMTDLMAKFVDYSGKHLPDDVEAKLKELAGPKVTWREGWPGRALNDPLCSVPLGAYCVRTISLTGAPRMTSLPAFKAKTCVG